MPKSKLLSLKNTNLLKAQGSLLSPEETKWWMSLYFPLLVILSRLFNSHWWWCSLLCNFTSKVWSFKCSKTGSYVMRTPKRFSFRVTGTCNTNSFICPLIQQSLNICLCARLQLNEHHHLLKQWIWSQDDGTADNFISRGWASSLRENHSFLITFALWILSCLV